jgi:hypothetical protein
MEKLMDTELTELLEDIVARLENLEGILTEDEQKPVRQCSRRPVRKSELIDVPEDSRGCYP